MSVCSSVCVSVSVCISVCSSVCVCVSVCVSVCRSVCVSVCISISVSISSSVRSISSRTSISISIPLPSLSTRNRGVSPNINPRVRHRHHTRVLIRHLQKHLSNVFQNPRATRRGALHIFIFPIHNHKHPLCVLFKALYHEVNWRVLNEFLQIDDLVFFNLNNRPVYRRLSLYMSVKFRKHDFDYRDLPSVVLAKDADLFLENTRCYCISIKTNINR